MKIVRRALAVLCAVALLALGTVLSVLKLNESELVFHTHESHAGTDGPIPVDARLLSIRETAAEPLAALIMPADPAHDSGLWVLHLHGNADSAFSAGQLRHAAALRALGLNVLAFDYRGFGRTAGKASETHIDEDAEAAYSELMRQGVDPAKLVIWGHSLGSGPAVYLAAHHRCAALVLFGAFTSIPDAAQDTYPYLPVKWLTGIHFDSIDSIALVHAPVLIVHSRLDRVIPYHHAQELFAAAHEPKQFFELPGPFNDGLGGHVDGLYEHLEVIAPALAGLTSPDSSTALAAPRG
jgi:pimeloyl-ACP methyl ester carboxylesterase